MIVVKIELWPRGNHKQPSTLSEILIYNVGGTAQSGNYQYKVSRRGGFKASPEDMARGEVKNQLRSGWVSGFPRLRLYATDLLFRVLDSAFGERNS